MDAGVVVTINSDDPPMFGTTLNREYEIAADLLDLDEAGVADLARTAVRVSFAPDDVKARILGEIDARGTTPVSVSKPGHDSGPGSSYLPGPPPLYDGVNPLPGTDTRSPPRLGG